MSGQKRHRLGELFLLLVARGRYNPLRGTAVGPPLEPGTRPVPRARDHEAGPVRVLPRDRAGARPAPAQPAVHDEALALRSGRGRLLPEAGAEGDALLDPTRTFRTYPREGESRLVDFPLVNSPEAVLWMVQMNCIDMNAWYSRVDKPHRPDFVLFDLDPPDGGFALAIRVAHLIREELERLELESYVKTSGADGIHVLVPIARRATFERTYAFAERVARGLEERHPGLVTTEWLKRKREGVLVDHRQNARGKTIASVYSVRPKPGAPVSTPLRWDELTEDVMPRRFGMREALERVEQHGDLFEPVLAGGQALGRALKKLR